MLSVTYAVKSVADIISAFISEENSIWTRLSFSVWMPNDRYGDVAGGFFADRRQRCVYHVFYQQGKLLGRQRWCGAGKAAETQVPEGAVGPVAPVCGKVNEISLYQPYLELIWEFQVSAAAAASDVDVKITDFERSDVFPSDPLREISIVRDFSTAKGVKPKLGKYSGTRCVFHKIWFQAGYSKAADAFLINRKFRTAF